MPGISKAAKPDLPQMLDVLQGIVGEGSVRRGAPADAVCGVVPGLYVEPADEAELGRVLRYANEMELMVCPRGGGTKLAWGTAPPDVDLAISTARFNRILEYAPGDMTVTAGAGVTIAQLQSALATHGQRLALDPLWPERATVGGVIATNDSGVLRVRYGGIRDLMIGATIVLADGTIAVSGGKVVKNVAGYDLPKLMAGSLGTLGIVTRAVFRLHPLPESSQSVTWTFLPQYAKDGRAADPVAGGGTTGAPVSGVPGWKQANDFILAIADSLVVPSGVQLRTEGQGNNGDGSQLPRSTHVDVRIDGIAAGIAAQMQTVRQLAGDVRPTGPEADPWQLREQLCSAAVAASNHCVIKLSFLPTQLASIAEFVGASLGEARSTAASQLSASAAAWKLLMYSTGLGWLRVDLAGSGAAECAQIAEFISVLRTLIAPTGGSAVLLQAPPAVRQRIDVWGDPGSALPLMVRLKQQFDPRGILNRGRFVGGI